MDERRISAKAGKGEEMMGWQSGDIEANGVRLHYTRTGGGKPLRRLLPGA